MYKYLLIIFTICSLCCNGQERPNILWLTIEDTSPQFIGCYGNESADTPVIDSLARVGIKFNNAFSTGTVCSPSRSAIITGVPTYKMGTGHHRSAYPIPDYIKGFPYYLKSSGYYTSNNYKTDYNVRNAKELIKESWDESSNEAGWWKRQNGQPFFSVFNFNGSHQSRTMTMPYEWYEKNVLNHLEAHEIIQPYAFEMPPFYKDSPEMRKQFARVYNSIKLTDKKIGQLLSRLHTEGLAESTIIFMFADHGEGIPRGKTNGINLGYRVPFIMVVPEKYAAWRPTLERASNSLISFEDLAPTVLSLAGIEPPSHMEGRKIAGKDISPERSYLYLSSDRADNGLDMVRTVTDGRFLYSRNFMPFMPEVKHIRYVNIGEITQVMRNDFNTQALSPIQRSLFSARPAEVLYDIDQDLWETENLIGTTPIEDTLRRYLYAEMERHKDIHLLPEYLIARLSETETPFEFRQVENKFAASKIIKCASLVGKYDKSSLAQMADYLSSDDEAISYWAALGLFSAPSETIDLFLPMIFTGLESEFPLTRLYCGAILYRKNGNSQGRDMLKKFILHEDQNIVLQSINLLLYIAEKEPFINEVRAIEQNKDAPYKLLAAALDFLTLVGLEDPSRQN